MKLSTRLIAVGACIPLIALSACTTGDTEFPSDDFELVIPYSPGGATDTAGRVFAAELEEQVGQQVVVVNRPGGGAAVALTEALSAQPDGYNLVLAPGSAFATVPLVQNVSFTAEDYRSVGGLYDQPYVIVVSNDSPIQSIEDLAEVDERITYTTYASGHVTHLSMATALQDMGVEGEPVPYDSATDSLQAVTSGQVDIGVIDMNIAAPQLESGAVTGIAVNSEEPHPSFPELPSFGEAGYSDSAGYLSRISIAVPADTPDDIASTLENILLETLDSDVYKQYREENFLLRPEFIGAEFFDEYVPDDEQRAESAFDQLGIERIND